MIIYIFLFLLFLPFLFKAEGYSITSQKRQIFLVAVVLIALYSFRGLTVGTDTLNYCNYYNNPLYSFSELFQNQYWFFYEPLWHFFAIFLKSIGCSFQLFNFIFICINLFVVYKTASKTKNPLLLFLLFYFCYYYFSGFNIMRQFTAANLFLYALVCLDNKKWWKFVCICLVASLFHRSALFVMPFVLLYFIPINYKMAMIGVVLSAALIIMDVDSLVFSNIDLFMFTDYYGAGTVQQYNKYLDTNVSGLNTYGIIMYWLLLSLKAVLFILLIWKKQSLTLSEKYWMLGVILTIFTANYSWLFRMGIYFMIPQILSIAEDLPDTQFTNRKKIIYSIILLIFLFNLYSNADGVVPYETL